MKIQNKRICLLVVIGLFFSPLFAYAKPKTNNFTGDKTRPGNEDQISTIQRQLGLSPEQAEQLKILRNTHRAKATQFRTIIRANKEELRKELQKKKLNMDRINQLHSELKMLMGQREDDRLKEILEARKILTPEQLIKFLELKKRYRIRSQKGNGKK